jgi:hypothetical protein
MDIIVLENTYSYNTEDIRVVHVYGNVSCRKISQSSIHITPNGYRPN